MSYVTDFPAAAPQEAVAHFAHRLSVETDCAEQFARRHIPGALHMPRAAINAQSMAQWPTGTLFVVYCAGPHCNGADRAALTLSRLGLPVKIMLGGITGWADEGFAFAGEDE